MAQALTDAQQDALQSDNVFLGFFYSAEYENDFVRAWTGYESKSFDSDGDGNDETFLGVGEFGSFSTIEETAEVRADGFTVQLSGVPIGGTSEVLKDAMREDYHGLDAKLWLAILDENFDIIDDPIMMNQGFQDQQEVNDSGDTLDVTVQIENPIRNLRGKSTLHYTSKDLQDAEGFSDDGFFDEVESIQTKKEQWGSNLN